MKSTKMLPLVISLMLTGIAPALAGDDLLQDAKAAYEKGEAKAASIHLKNLLQEQPENVDARLLLGEVYIKLGDGPSAEKELQRAQELGAPPEKWVMSLGRAFMLQNHSDWLFSKIKVDEDWSPSLRAQLEALKGLARLNQNEPEKARALFESATRLDATKEEPLLGLAMLEARENHFRETAKYAEQALEKNPKSSEAWTILGEARRMDGDTAGAAEAFGKAIELDKNDIRALSGHAVANLTLSKIDVARADLEKLKALAPKLPMTQYLLGALAFQDGRLEEAEEALVKVYNASESNLPALLLLGSISFQQSKFESAENYLSKLVAHTHGHPLASKLLGATRMKLNNPKGAIEVLKPLADAATPDPQVLALLGSAYMKDKQYDRGAEILTKAAQVSPNAGAVRAELGLSRIATGKIEQAVADFKAASAADPNLVQADILLVLALIQDKKVDEALAAAQKLKEKRKDDPMPDNLIAAVQLAKGDRIKAEESWRKALAIRPSFSPAAVNLARLALAEGKVDVAEREFENIRSTDPNNLQALLGLAQIAERKGDSQALLKRLQEAKDSNPQALEPVVGITQYYLRRNQPLQALDVARSAADAQPANLSLAVNLSEAQLAAKQGASAVTTLRRAVDAAPENPDFRHRLALALVATGDKIAANKEWAALLAKSPDFVPALLAKGQLAIELTDLSQAQKIADEIKAKQPKGPYGYQLAGDIRFTQKQFGKAATEYEQAYERMPSALTAQRLFRARIADKQEPQAIEGLKKWLSTAKGDVESWVMLAMTHQTRGRLPEATDAYEKAYEANPSLPLVLNNLAWIYQEQGDKRAVEIAEKIPVGNDTSPEMLDTAGWVLANNGKVEKGLGLLKQASVTAPHIPMIRIHLAQALAIAGNKDDARKELERLLKEKKEFPERAQAEAALSKL